MWEAPTDGIGQRLGWRVFAHWLGWSWLSVANLLALCGVIALLLTSPQFQVTQVIIAREWQSSATLAQAHELSNVVGRSIFLLQTGRLEQEIEALPSVRAAQVRARLPDRIIVEITKRQPAAVWQAVNGAFLVDLEGQIIGPAADDAPDQPAMVIQETNGIERVPGQRIERRVLLTARELRRVLPQLGIDPLAIEYGTLGRRWWGAMAGGSSSASWSNSTPSWRTWRPSSTCNAGNRSRWK